MGGFESNVGGRMNRINQLRMADSSPEKAGVGSSIPSLATNSLVCKYLEALSISWDQTPPVSAQKISF